MAEHIIWKGSPSQWVNLITIIFCGALFIAIPFFDLPLWLLFFPVIIAGWKYMSVRCTIYEITSERLLISKGVFSRTTDNIEFYSIKDVRLIEPFFLRLANLSNVDFITTDKLNEVLIIKAVETGNTFGKK